MSNTSMYKVLYYNLQDKLSFFYTWVSNEEEARKRCMAQKPVKKIYSVIRMDK